MPSEAIFVQTLRWAPARCYSASGPWAVYGFLAAYQRMREQSRRSGVYAFAITPKTHKVQHLPKLTTCINPVRVQVYSEESMMGSVTGTWRGSARGRYKEEVQRIVLVKQLTGVLLRFELAL